MKAFLATLIGISVAFTSISQLAAQDQNPAANAQGAQARAALPAPAAPAPEPLGETARGLALRPDGTCVGIVNYIDPSSLTLVPTPNAIVTFMQNRRVVAQQRTGATGEFAVKGLTPSAIYSMFVTHQEWFCAMSIITVPVGPAAADNNPSASRAVNRFALLVAKPGQSPVSVKATAAKLAKLNATFEPQDLVQIQIIPREDFIAALRMGVLGNDLGGIAPGGVPGGAPGGGAGGGAGGGSGGGGGGGGGGGDIGGLLGAAGIAAGIAAGASNNNRTRPLSNFTP